jgi:hypothetical protein
MMTMMNGSSRWVKGQRASDDAHDRPLSNIVYGLPSSRPYTLKLLAPFGFRPSKKVDAAKRMLSIFIRCFDASVERSFLRKRTKTPIQTLGRHHSTSDAP